MSYDSEVLADTPIGYWRLQDASTTMTDYSGNGRNGTLVGSSGSSYQLQQPSLIESEPSAGCLGLMYSGAYNAGWTGMTTVVGSPAYVTIPYNAAWNILGDFTAEIWIKFYPGYWPSCDTIIGRRKTTLQWALTSNVNPSFNIWFDGSTNGIWQAYGAGAAGFPYPRTTGIAGITYSFVGSPVAEFLKANAPSLNPDIYDGNPHHLVGVRRGTAIELYIDGILVGYRLFGDTPQSNTSDPIIIGSYTDGGFSGLCGWLQKFAFYNTALSHARILAHYDAAKKKVMPLHLGWALDAPLGASYDAEPLAMSDVAQYFYSAGMVSPNQDLIMSDVASSFLALGNAITDGFSTSDTGGFGMIFNPTVTEALTTTDADSGIKQIAESLADGLATSDTQAAGAVQVGVITDEAVVYCGLRHGGESYAGYVLNADTNASSFYEGFDFNSLAKIGPDYFGAGPTGVFKLEGSTDAGAPIEAMLNVGNNDAMTAYKKSYDSVYLGLTAGGKMVMKVVVDGTEHFYEATNSAPVMKEVRVTPGKGLQATFWTFELWNQDGCDFDIASVDFYPVVLTRRL